MAKPRKSASSRLTSAINDKNIAEVEKIITEERNDINLGFSALHSNGDRIIHRAVQSGEVEILNAVLSLSPEAKYINGFNINSETPLMIAIKLGNIKVVYSLLNLADIDLKTKGAGNIRDYNLGIENRSALGIAENLAKSTDETETKIYTLVQLRRQGLAILKHQVERNPDLLIVDSETQTTQEEETQITTENSNVSYRNKILGIVSVSVLGYGLNYYFNNDFGKAISALTASLVYGKFNNQINMKEIALNSALFFTSFSAAKYIAPDHIVAPLLVSMATLTIKDNAKELCI